MQQRPQQVGDLSQVKEVHQREGRVRGPVGGQGMGRGRGGLRTTVVIGGLGNRLQEGDGVRAQRRV